MKYALILNDMRQPNIENIEVVKIADTKEELMDWYKSMQVESYLDGQWGKQFKKGSKLEWYNGVHDLEKLNDYWGGIWEVADNAQIGDGLRKSF